MIQLSNDNKLITIYNYISKAIPAATKLLGSIAAYMPAGLSDKGLKGQKAPLCKINDLKCACVLASWNSKHLEDCLEFLVPLYVLCHTLDLIAESRKPTDLSEVEMLYRPLIAAVDPHSMSSWGCECYRNQDTTDALIKLSDTCRSKLFCLPEYMTAAGKMKKYVRLYVEFQSLKYQPYKTRRQQMMLWSDYYIHQFPDISFWEFSAAADSLLGVSAAYITARDGIMSEIYAGKLDSAYLPWICTYQKMLQYFVTAREDQMTGCLNLSHYYKNLKQCEERLLYAGKKALAYCTVLPDCQRHAALVQAMPVIYLSDPQAGFGLARLASRNIMKDGTHFSRALWNWNRFVNSFK